LSYPVIDATTILYANPDSLKYHVFDTERILTIFGSLIPRILWRDKPYFGSSLLDNIMARTFGYQIQGEKSGWPTGFITEGLAIAGITGVIFSSITIGVVVFFLNQIQGFVLLNHPRHFFTVAYTCTFLLIAVYKDGDTISALIGSIKTFLWMFIIISGLEFIVRRRLS
jgi:hypothetical protein